MICVSIGKCTAQKCITLIRGIGFAEVRIDLLSGKIGKEEVMRIFSSHKNLVATCRKGKLSEKKCAEFLLDAINAGAAYVDIDVETSEKIRKKIISAARKKKCKVIVSYHNYEFTPTSKKLEAEVGKCFHFGAEIAKIACMANNNYDCLKLISLLDRKGKIAVVGMGKKGKAVRVLAPLLGSQIAYVAYDKKHATADGQMTENELIRAQRLVLDGA